MKIEYKRSSFFYMFDIDATPRSAKKKKMFRGKKPTPLARQSTAPYGSHSIRLLTSLQRIFECIVTTLVISHRKCYPTYCIVKNHEEDNIHNCELPPSDVRHCTFLQLEVRYRFTFRPRKTAAKEDKKKLQRLVNAEKCKEYRQKKKDDPVYREAEKLRSQKNRLERSEEQRIHQNEMARIR